jgi:hypothetical protein
VKQRKVLAGVEDIPDQVKRLRSVLHFKGDKQEQGERYCSAVQAKKPLSGSVKAINGYVKY